MEYKLTFLGTNDFFANGINEFHTNAWLEDEDERAILLDCGTDAKVSMKKSGKNVENLEAVYVSHLHPDHCGGISWLGFYSLFKLGRKLKLFIDIDLVDPLWRMLHPGMGKAAGNIMILHDYFDIVPIRSKMFPYFSWNGVNFDVIPVPHVRSGFRHNIDWPHNEETWTYSYGLSFGNKTDKFWFTTDTCIANFAKEKHWWDYDENDGFFKDYRSYYYEHSMIFHDCCINTSAVPTSKLVHSEYNNLAKFPEEIRNKMWLVHHPSICVNRGYGKSTVNVNMLDMAEEDGFLGFMKRSKTFKF